MVKSYLWVVLQTTARNNAMRSDMTVKVTYFSFVLTVNLSMIVHPYIQELANDLYGLEKAREEPGKDMTKLWNRIAGKIHPRKMQTGTRGYSPCSWLRISSNLLRSPRLSADAHPWPVEPSPNPQQPETLVMQFCVSAPDLTTQLVDLVIFPSNNRSIRMPGLFSANSLRVLARERLNM